MTRFLNFFFTSVLIMFSGAAQAQEEDILVVASADGVTEVHFQMAELLELAQTVVVTANEFVDGEKMFSGPLMRDVLAMLHAEPTENLILTAANDYQVKLPVRELYDYDVILALEMDGMPLSRREKGPIWVIYPMSDNEELQDPFFNSRLIWQLVRIGYE